MLVMPPALRNLLTFFGAAVMLAAYYVWHKPVTVPVLLNLGGALADVLTALLIFAVSGGVGRTVLVFAPTEQLSKPERAGMEGIVGLCVLSWVGLVLGVTGAFTTLVLWITLVVVALLVNIGLRSYARDVLHLCYGLFTAGYTRWTQFLAGFVAFMLLTALLVALMPPTAWDSLMYHMLLPKRLLQTGQLVAYPDNHYTGFPQTVEIMFAWAAGLFGRDTSAALVHYGAGLLGLVTVAGTLRRYAETHVMWLAVALLLGGGSFWLGFTREYVDMAVFALSAGALAVLTVWRTSGGRAWLVVMGLLAGLAVGVKYTAGMLAIALGVAVLVTQPRRVVRHGLVMAGVALLVYLPWGLRGLVQYGNPFYPFFYGVFGGIGWDAARAAGFSSSGDGLLAQGPLGVVRLVLLPFVATAAGTEGGVRYSFDAGVWLMPLAVTVLLGWDRLTDEERPVAKTAGLLLLPMLALWMAGGALSGIGAQTRLVIPVFPAFAMLSALGFESMSRWPRRPMNVYFIVRVLVIFALVASAFGTLVTVANNNPGGVILGAGTPQNTRDSYLFRTTGAHYVALQQLDDVLGDGARVRFAYEPKAYYCPATVYCDPDALTDHWLHPLLTEGRAPDEIITGWRDDVDGVLFFRQGYEQFFLREPGVPFKEENALFAPALERYMELLWEDDAGAYQIYGWRE